MAFPRRTNHLMYNCLNIFISFFPLFIGDSAGTRTQDPHIKSVVLWPTELRSHHLTCGKGRTRTYSALGQQIYSLPRLSNFAAFPNSLCLFSFDAAKEIWPTAVFFRSKKNFNFCAKNIKFPRKQWKMENKKYKKNKVYWNQRLSLCIVLLFL